VRTGSLVTCASLLGRNGSDLSTGTVTALVAVFGPDDAVQGLGQVDESGLLAPQRRFNL